MANAIQREGPVDALKIALIVAVVCALLVSTAAVTLRPFYLANIAAEREAQLETVVAALAGSIDGVSVSDLNAHVVELASGRYDDDIDPRTFDMQEAAVDSERSVAIPPQLDVANVRRRPRHATVLTVRDASGAIQVLILPVWGSGYQSTLFGYLALAGDGNTVLALKFYQHGETPGIGARIEDPNWTALWAGKQIYDERDEVRIGVAKGPVARGSSRYTHEVDGLSGATRTSDGVTNLLRYWLSDHGYGPYLKRIRRAEA